jgi:hypothetical protein
MRRLVGLLAVLMFVGPAFGWEYWGDLGGTRFSTLAQITPANVASP